jgi:Mn2+/Fe2+ NRAMP family transporter
MSFSFLITAIITKPDAEAVLRGLFMPSAPENSLLTIIALVGTTVVPYNLFLHASLVSEKWKSASDLGHAKRDTMISIAIGGLISMAIIITATSITSAEVTSALDLAKGLEPLFGHAARYFMGIGLFAAGITSAITAPLAAAYVANSCFGWKASMKDTRFRLVWILIIGIGICSLSFEITPIEIIKFAQVANGLLLPIIAIFLLWIVNKSAVLGNFKNTIWHNILGMLIIGLALLLGAKSIFKVFGLV